MLWRESNFYRAGGIGAEGRSDFAGSTACVGEIQVWQPLRDNRYVRQCGKGGLIVTVTVFLPPILTAPKFVCAGRAIAAHTSAHTEGVTARRGHSLVMAASGKTSRSRDDAHGLGIRGLVLLHFEFR